ncbi:MAG: hypothetical protein EBU81_14205, partial [Proteobacteria bacterium]|nr:hypothetical protein [Pseudomonadota bacterium]
IQALQASLPQTLREKHERFESRIREIHKVLALHGELARLVHGDDLHRLDDLSDGYLGMLSLLHRQRSHLAEHDPARIRREIDEVCRELAKAAPGGHREALEENLEVLQRRQERLGILLEERQILTTRADLVEDTLNLVYEQVLAIRSDPGGSRQIEPVLSSIEVAERTLAEMARLEANLDNPSWQADLLGRQPRMEDA